MTLPPTLFPVRPPVRLPVLLGWVALVQLALAPAAARAAEGETAAGSVSLDLRYRVEAVEDDRAPRDALASTLRTALRLESRLGPGWSAVIEAENSAVVGNDELFNDAGATGNGVTDRPVVADAESTELNQAYLRFERYETRVTLGRQELLFGDQRFVGPVGWRQNHQSFDALSLVDESLSRWRFQYALTGRVHRIVGDSRELTAHLLEARRTLPIGRLSLYTHLLDYREARDAPLSSSTAGVEWRGERELSGSTLSWEVEAARQTDWADNPRSLDADYHHLAVGGSSGPWKVGAGWERLGADEGVFRTPLATLHKFNGWADRFLATPDAGLDDVYASIGRSFGRSRALVVAHEFTAAQAGTEFGREVDLLWATTTGRSIELGVKAALFEATDSGADGSKVMVWGRRMWKHRWQQSEQPGGDDE